MTVDNEVAIFSIGDSGGDGEDGEDGDGDTIGGMAGMAVLSQTVCVGGRGLGEITTAAG